VTLRAFAAERRAAALLLVGTDRAHQQQRTAISIDISCRTGSQQQTRRTAPRLMTSGSKLKRAVMISDWCMASTGSAAETDAYRRANIAVGLTTVVR